MKKVFIIGGAGFIGSTLAKRLLSSSGNDFSVTVYDNFSSGTRRHLQPIISDPRLAIISNDVKNLNALVEAMQGHDTVWHFASNPDIAKAVSEPVIDFFQGTFLTNNVVEAMRRSGVSNLIYSSGSGVYGDTGEKAVSEDFGPMVPISTYGASKLAGEALIASYCHMFGLRARAYRFANVVGPMQTHGVGFDFIRRLRKDPNYLRILGDGNQSKSYIHVDDVLDAIMHTKDLGSKPYDVYNVATGDYITVNEIADIAITLCCLQKDVIKIEHTSGDRGWKGDVPIIRFDLGKIHGTGWRAKITSRQALTASMQAMNEELASAAN